MKTFEFSVVGVSIISKDDKNYYIAQLVSVDQIPDKYGYGQRTANAFTAQPLKLGEVVEVIRVENRYQIIER